jgi:hypothetical protein
MRRKLISEVNEMTIAMLAREGGGQMSPGFLFWLLVILAILFGGYWYWPGRAGTAGYGPFGNHLLYMILLILLGIGVFGWPL